MSVFHQERTEFITIEQEYYAFIQRDHAFVDFVSFRFVSVGFVSFRFRCRFSEVLSQSGKQIKRPNILY
jgi:hypothetical protein